MASGNRFSQNIQNIMVHRLALKSGTFMPLCPARPGQGCPGRVGQLQAAPRVGRQMGRFILPSGERKTQTDRVIHRRTFQSPVMIFLFHFAFTWYRSHMEPEPCKCFESWSEDLKSRSDRVRRLIGDAHWLSDGHHRTPLHERARPVHI